MPTIPIDHETVEASIREMALVSEGEECDHDVNICWCGFRETERSLKLALTGKRACTSCGGDGFTVVEVSGGSVRCVNCDGSGEEPIERS